MIFLSTDLAPVFVTLLLGLGKLALVFMALWIPLTMFFRFISFRNIRP